MPREELKDLHELNVWHSLPSGAKRRKEYDTARLAK